MRRSRLVTHFGGTSFCILAGKYTGQLGVTEVLAGPGVPLRVTGIERTLIDIAVRPDYAGGVFEVKKAYTNAASRVSVNKMMAMLRKLDYVYPYHQGIGFYLEQSGAYDSWLVDLARKFPFQYDFYLAYGMREPSYSERWRLFYPKSF
jgi:predicted transcriptional regulator of viral defense system